MLRRAVVALIALSPLACARFARRPAPSDRIFDACLAEGRSLDDCKRRAGCSERLTEAECRKSFRKRHELYIHYN